MHGVDSAEEALSVCSRWSYIVISSHPASCLAWACRTYRLPYTAVRGWTIEKRGRAVSGCRGKSSRTGRLHIRKRNVEDGKDWQKNHLCGSFWGWTRRIAVLLTPQTQKASILFWLFTLAYLQCCGRDVLGTVQTHLQPKSFIFRMRAAEKQQKKQVLLCRQGSCSMEIKWFAQDCGRNQSRVWG